MAAYTHKKTHMIHTHMIVGHIIGTNLGKYTNALVTYDTYST